MARQWTEEQKQAASERMKAKNESEKSGKVSARIRKPMGAKRDITAVHDTPKGFVDRWVNDDPGRIARFEEAGYETVETANVGSHQADDTHAEAGVVSKDMGKGVTAVLMRQREEYFHEDQAEKQRIVDETEDALRRKKVNPNESTDGMYGEVTIGKK